MTEARLIPAETLYDETMAAFMGALDDIAESTEASGGKPDNEIAERVLGLFDNASTFYDADMSRNFELVDTLAVRLGDMVCGGHAYMEGALEQVASKFGTDKDDIHAGHNHNHVNGSDEDDEPDGKGKKKKRSRGTLWGDCYGKQKGPRWA
jgi:hypothetical protein